MSSVSCAVPEHLPTKITGLRSKPARRAAGPLVLANKTLCFNARREHSYLVSIAAKSMAPSELTDLIRCERAEHIDLWMHNIFSGLAFQTERICVGTPPPPTKPLKNKETPVP